MSGPTVQALIDAAAKMCGGQNQLARRIGTTKGALSSMKAGTRPVPTVLLAHMLNIVEWPGEQARELLANAEIGNPKHAKNPRITEVLRRAFFGCLVAGAAMVSHDSHASGNRAPLSEGDSLYIVPNGRGQKRGRWRRLTAHALERRTEQPTRAAQTAFQCRAPVTGGGLRATPPALFSRRLHPGTARRQQTQPSRPAGAARH